MKIPDTCGDLLRMVGGYRMFAEVRQGPQEPRWVLMPGVVFASRAWTDLSAKSSRGYSLRLEETWMIPAQSVPFDTVRAT